MGIRVHGATLSCAGCGQVIYPDCRVLANHTISTLPDGRVRWWSRDFELVVHVCDTTVAGAAAERSGELPVPAHGLEQFAALMLDLLAVAGVPTSRR